MTISVPFHSVTIEINITIDIKIRDCKQVDGVENLKGLKSKEKSKSKPSFTKLKSVMLCVI